MIVAAVLRHVLAAPARWAPVVLLVAVAVAVYGGTGGGLHQIERSTEQLYTELALPDIVLHVSGATRQRLPAEDLLLEDLPPGTRLAWSFESPGVVDAHDGDATSATVRTTVPGRAPTVNRPGLREGEPLRGGDPDGVWLDPRWAQEHGVSIGDTITLELPVVGGDVVVRGFAIYPDQLLTSADESATMPVVGSRAIVTISEERLYRRLFWRVPVNRLSVTAPPGSDLADVQRSLSDKLSSTGLEVGRVERGEDLFSVVCHRGRLNSMRDTLPAMVLIFQGLAALGWFLALRHLIEQWRTSAGTLRAFGIGSGSIALAWLAVIGGLNAFGALIGGGLAQLLGHAIVERYQTATGFPALPGDIAWQPTLEVLAFTALWVPFVLVPVLSTLAQRPTDLLRRGTDRATATLGGTGAWVDHIPPAPRLGLLRILRAPLQSGATVLSVAGTVTIAISMWVFSTAHLDNIEAMLGSRQWDAVWVGHPGASSTGLLDATDWEPVHTADARMRIDDRSFEAQALAFPIPSRFQTDDWLVDGRPLDSTDERGVLVGARHRSAYGLAIGDELELSLDGGAPSAVTIMGIVNAFSRDQVVLHPSTLEALASETSGSFALLRGSAESLEAIAHSNRTAMFVRRQRLADTAMAVTNSFVLTVRTYGGLGALAAWTLLLSSALTRLHDRSPQNAALSALGLPPGFAFRAALTEVLCIAVLAGALAVPLVYAATTVFQARFAEAGMFVPLHHDALLVGLCLGVPPALSLAVAPLLLRRIRNNRLSSALSYRE